MTEKRLHIVVSGRVQGVWYRASTREKARALGLRGTVWNRADGRVEIIGEGEEIALRRLLEWAAEGPPAARVSGLESDWGTATGEFADFGIS